VLGVAGGILAVAALVAVVFVVGTRRRRGCAPRREDDHVTVELQYFDDAPTTTRFCRVRELLAQAGINATIELRRVEKVEDAERERFLGSRPSASRSAMSTRARSRARTTG
jgi:hypothetical protein